MYEIKISNKRKLFPVYSTPDRVIFEEPIEVNERVMEWLLACHILEAKEIVWQR